MDVLIRKIEKEAEKIKKHLKTLEVADKKRDVFCEAGKKLLKKK